VAILEQEEAEEIGGIIHCFTGTRELAERALVLGFCISFSGIVAFPRSEVIREVARTVPRERLLVETDAPFLAPPPHRGKRNEPAFVVEVARTVAELRGEPVEDVARAGAREFRTRLPSAGGLTTRSESVTLGPPWPTAPSTWSAVWTCRR
jgi:TatD DNase family protein